MEKKQSNAKILSVEELEGFDDRCRVVFSYEEAESTSDNDVFAFLASCVRNNTYNVIARIPKTMTLADMQSKLENQVVPFTTYILTISEAFEGTTLKDFNAVKNTANEHVYASINKSYVGVFNDDTTAKKSMMQKLFDRINNDEYEACMNDVDTPKKEEPKKEEKVKLHVGLHDGWGVLGLFTQNVFLSI